MKALLAVAVGAFLASACGSSGNDDPAPLDGTPSPSSDMPVIPAPTGPDAPPPDDAGNIPPIASPEDAPATITADNYVDVLSDVFATFTGNDYAAQVFPLPYFPMEPAGMDFIALADARDTLSLTCENGGTADYSPLSYGAGTGLVEGWVLDGCQRGARVVTGELEKTLGAGSGALYAFESAGLVTAESQDESVAFDGYMSYLPTGSRGYENVEWNATIDRLTLARGEDVLELSDLDTAYSYGRAGSDVIASLSGGFTLTSSATSGRAVSVEVIDALSRVFDPDIPENERVPVDLATFSFEQGTLRVTAPDGNVLELDAATGDDATARVTITTDGRQEDIVADWSVWLEDLRYARDGRLGGVGDY